MLNVTITKDLTTDIIESLKELNNKSVCIGIPQEENTVNGGIKNAELLYLQSHGVRKKSMINEMNITMGINSDGTPYDVNYDDFSNNLDKMPYSTAYQLYISSHGSPLWHIPPRPVLEPAIENSKELLAKEMEKVVEIALDGGNIDTGLDAVGMLGQNVARDWFTNPENLWAKNSDMTIKIKGSDKPLIDTGNLRKSIIYVSQDGVGND